MANHVSTRNYLNSGGLITFTIDSNTKMNTSLYEIGRAVLRTWVYLNAQGYVVQPITTSTMLSFQAKHNKLPPTCLEELKNLFIDGKRIWSKFFNVPQNLEVVWALRVGLPKEITKKREVSKRLRFDQVVEL